MTNYFGTQGEKSAIKVTVGGILFDDHIEFEAMFLAAERQLMASLQSGVIELSRQGESFSDWRVN